MARNRVWLVTLGLKDTLKVADGSHLWFSLLLLVALTGAAILLAISYRLGTGLIWQITKLMMRVLSDLVAWVHLTWHKLELAIDEAYLTLYSSKSGPA